MPDQAQMAIELEKSMGTLTGPDRSEAPSYLRNRLTKMETKNSKYAIVQLF